MVGLVEDDLTSENRFLTVSTVQARRDDFCCFPPGVKWRDTSDRELWDRQMAYNPLHYPAGPGPAVCNVAIERRA